MVLTIPAEQLKPGGSSHHLLEQLYRCHILSESAERQWGSCRVTSAPDPGRVKQLLLGGIPYMVCKRPEALLRHTAVICPSRCLPYRLQQKELSRVCWEHHVLTWA